MVPIYRARGQASLDGSPETYIRPKRQFQIDFTAVLVFVVEREPFSFEGRERLSKPLHGNERHVPSVSPFVSTSVKSTKVSPIRSGPLGSSAKHAMAMLVPPLIFLTDRQFLGGGGGGVPAPLTISSTSS